MTADWEQKLLRMEQGDYEAQDFMREIREMVSELVENYEAVKGAETLMNPHKKVGACPCCQADVLERQKGWFCSNKECRFVLWKDNAFFKSIGKQLTASMVEKLLSDGRIRMKGCKSKKSGKDYNATLVLSTEDKRKSQFQPGIRNKTPERERRKRAMTPEKKEGLYLVDNEAYLHLKETADQGGFSYETFDKTTGQAGYKGLITYGDMLDSPIRSPLACARVLAIEEIGYDGHVVAEVALRTLEQLKDARRAYRLEHEDDPKDRSIRFITSKYDELFRIPDGGKVKIDYPDRSFVALANISTTTTRGSAEKFFISVSLPRYWSAATARSALNRREC